MKQTLFQALLATTAGLMLVAGAASAAAAAGTSTGASANVAAAAECQVDNPKWEVTWTSEDAVTLRQCGGTAGAADTVTDDELPLTGAGAGARVAAGGAAILLGAGAGLVLAARRGRVTFTA